MIREEMSSTKALETDHDITTGIGTDPGIDPGTERKDETRGREDAIDPGREGTGPGRDAAADHEREIIENQGMTGEEADTKVENPRSIRKDHLLVTSSE